VFFVIFGCGAHFKSELRRKWQEIDQDNLRTGTAKARYMSLAKITCCTMLKPLNKTKFY